MVPLAQEINLKRGHKSPLSVLTAERGQALLESAVIMTVLALALHVLVALVWWIYIYWGAQASIYEYLVCRSSIQVSGLPSCRTKLVKKLDHFSFGLLSRELRDQDSLTNHSCILKLDGPLGLKWTIQDSVKLPLGTRTLIPCSETNKIQKLG